MCNVSVCVVVSIEYMMNIRSKRVAVHLLGVWTRPPLSWVSVVGHFVFFPSPYALVCMNDNEG